MNGHRMRTIMALMIGGSLIVYAASSVAQTIDSRDHRTFQDDRGQDTRHSPGPLPPDVSELLKRIDEEPARAPAPSEADKGERDKAPSTRDRPEGRPAPPVR